MANIRCLVVANHGEAIKKLALAIKDDTPVTDIAFTYKAIQTHAKEILKMLDEGIL